jgi:hypothetical protein
MVPLNVSAGYRMKSFGGAVAVMLRRRTDQEVRSSQVYKYRMKACRALLYPILLLL